jgi:hypothetical protein
MLDRKIRTMVGAIGAAFHRKEVDLGLEAAMQPL